MKSDDLEALLEKRGRLEWLIGFVRGIQVHHPDLARTADETLMKEVLSTFPGEQRRAHLVAALHAALTSSREEDARIVNLTAKKVEVEEYLNELCERINDRMIGYSPDAPPALRKIAEAIKLVSRFADDPDKAVPKELRKAATSLVREAASHLPERNPYRSYLEFELEPSSDSDHMPSAGVMSTVKKRRHYSGQRNSLRELREHLGQHSILQTGSERTPSAQASPSDLAVPISHAASARSQATSNAKFGFQATVLQVLIASPGDTLADRETIREGINGWNDLNARRLKLLYLPLMWERHATPEAGDRPQAFINKRLLGKADLVICALKNRFGSPTGTHGSGTAEEIEGALKAGKHVGIYVSDEQINPSQIDHQQRQQLQMFVASMRDKALLGSYKTQSELQALISRDLTNLSEEFDQTVQSGREAPVATSILAQTQPSFRGAAERARRSWDLEAKNRRSESTAQTLLMKLEDSLQEHLASHAENLGQRLVLLLESALHDIHGLGRIDVDPDCIGDFWKRGSAVLDRLVTIASRASTYVFKAGALEITLDVESESDRPSWIQIIKNPPYIEGVLRIRNTIKYSAKLQAIDFLPAGQDRAPSFFECNTAYDFEMPNILGRGEERVLRFSNIAINGSPGLGSVLWVQIRIMVDDQIYVQWTGFEHKPRLDLL